MMHNDQTVEINSNQPAMQAEILASMVQESLSKIGCNFTDINSIAIDIGPGSFTGIRIGLAYVAGIRMALPALRIIPIDTLHALTTICDKPVNMMAIVHCHGQQFYAQAFLDNQSLGQEIVATSSEILALAYQYSCERIIMAHNSSSDFAQQISAFHHVKAAHIEHTITASTILQYYLRHASKELWDQSQIIMPKYIKDFKVTPKT